MAKKSKGGVREALDELALAIEDFKDGITPLLEACDLSLDKVYNQFDARS